MPFKNIFYVGFMYVTIAFCGELGVALASQCEIASACQTDLTNTACGEYEYLAPGSSIFGCCPSCQLGNAPPDVCTAPASCLPDGRFAPIQCKGDHFTGRCFCTDAKGSRIFGQMWRSEANHMTCACSRRRSDLMAGGRTDVTLHCTPAGDYEPLQCDSGMCWCAETRTGQPTVTPVHERDMHKLTCYNAALHGVQYLRRCESVVYAMAVLHQEQADHGTHFFYNPTTNCDYDGTYGSYQVTGTIAYCTGRDGEILGPWQAIFTDSDPPNCNCARDTQVYFPERGFIVSAVCLASGNYQPNQRAGDWFYCVDTDGYQVTPFAEYWPADNCASFA